MTTPQSGDMCSFGLPPVPAHYVTHYRCDDHADGTVTNSATGEVVTRAPIGSPRGFDRTADETYYRLRLSGLYDVPPPLAGVITPTQGGVFRNAYGDFIVEPGGVVRDTGELILVRTDGTTATLTGKWSVGWEA